MATMKKKRAREREEQELNDHCPNKKQAVPKPPLGSSVL
jgi:hypothetical protein